MTAALLLTAILAGSVVSKPALHAQTWRSRRRLDVNSGPSMWEPCVRF
jgi:hypothetical protein